MAEARRVLDPVLLDESGKPEPGCVEAAGAVFSLTRQRQRQNQIRESLLEAQKALRSCVRQLEQLRAESEAMLDMLHSYTGQVALLVEIHSLKARFAIDWCPTQRLLVYLKSAALVCHLQVEDGYPAAGSARLSAVLRNGQPVDTEGLKKAELSLTDWLVFLCSSPLI